MVTKQKSMASNLQQKWQDAFAKRDVKAFSTIYAPDAVVHDPMYPQPLKTKSAIEKDFSDFVKAFPDITVKFSRSFEKESWVATEWQMTGTHKGPLTGPNGTIAATNKKIDLKGADIYRFNAAGQIVEEYRYFDTGTIATQLGVQK